jgi:deoxyribose-phosphate aldolase
VRDVAGMIDLSAVRPDTTEDDVRALAATAVRYRCACATTHPSYTPLLVDLLSDEPAIRVNGNVAFPAGMATTAIKVAEAKALLRMGCEELDVVLHLGLLRSGRDQLVLDEIRALVDVAGDAPVKAILECHYLSNDEIRRGCELCVQAGAAFVKTGTGWAPTGATPENVALLRSCVGDAIGIKAAGGIRSLDMLEQLYRLGARRFGIGYRSAQPILEQCRARSGHA